MRCAPIKRGFSLPELLVVVAIISIVASLIFVNYNEARKVARDEQRITHLEQLSVAFKLYRERYNGWPDCTGGIRIEEGGSFDWYTMNSGGVQDTAGCNDRATITAFFRDVAFEGVPIDPLGPGDLDYYYYFDSSHICATTGAATTPIVFATNLEVTESNAGEECPAVGGNDGGYIRSDTYGGSINPSQPYVIRLSKD